VKLNDQRSKAGQLEAAWVGGRVVDRRTHVGESELGGVEDAQIEQARPDQLDQLDVGGRRVHPLAAHGDAVAHQPHVRGRCASSTRRSRPMAIQR